MQAPQHEEIHPKGHLERYKTVERKKSFHCSAYDIKVVHFQEQESKLSGLEGLERRLDRVSRRSGLSQSVETPRRSCTTRRVFTDVDKTKVLKGYSSMEAANTSKPKPILQSKNRMYIVDGGASLHVMGESVPLPQERKPYGRPKTWRSKPRMTSTVPQKEAIICIQELGTCCT